MPDSPIPPPAAMRMFQITEDDLAELERTLPDFADRLMGLLDNKLRTRIRRVQTILTNVRWNYGPPMQVESFPADGPLPGEEDA